MLEELAHCLAVGCCRDFLRRSSYRVRVVANTTGADVDGAFTQAEFYTDIMGHPQHDNVRLALEELRFFSHHVEILGVYPADRFRERMG